MASVPPSPADATALAERQARVRALSLRIAQAVEATPLPESFLEGERAARAITVADRMLARLPQPETGDAATNPTRLRLRRFADRVFAIIEDLPSPKTFLDGERAGRCVLATARLFDQLYAPPKRLKNTLEDIDADMDSGINTGARQPDESTAAISARLLEDIDQLTLAHARDVGFYPDGSACDPAAPGDYDRLSCREDARLMSQWLAATADPNLPPEDGIHLVARIMTARANASTRARARHDGQWPDGRPFRDTDPDFYAISKAFAAVVMHQPGPGRADVREDPGPPLFPWWLVRADTS